MSDIRIRDDPMDLVGQTGIQSEADAALLVENRLHKLR